MTHVLIAPDKFKGSLSAFEAADTIAEVIKRNTSANLLVAPLADGGEGTAEILTKANDGTFKTKTVNDPLFRPVNASYGLSRYGKTAFIEMAAASGMALLREDEMNPLKTTSFGTGELIRDAIGQGVKNIILGVGGSATNDAGIGMAAALGYRFLDSKGNILQPTGGNLKYIDDIDISSSYHLEDFQVTLAADVTNPLYGPNGAAAVYAPQKGADNEKVELLEEGLKNFANIVQKVFAKDITQLPGAGAAGGMGAGAVTFLNANIVSGISIVLEELQFDKKLNRAEIIFTGEGSFDDQSLQGKVVGELLKKAQESNKPVFLVCGRITTPQIPRIVVDHIQLIDLASPQEAIENARDCLRKATFEIIKKNTKVFSD